MKDKSDILPLERLIQEIGRGDKSALERLYAQMRVPIYTLALSYVKNAEDAADVTQDTFLRVWENADRYEPRGTPKAWLLTIARNLALMRLRERTRQGEMTEEEWNAIPARAAEVTSEDRTVLQAALARLGDEERQVVLMHAAAGLKHREIASILELPISTVLSKYRRALKKMKAFLEGDEVP